MEEPFVLILRVCNNVTVINHVVFTQIYLPYTKHCFASVQLRANLKTFAVQNNERYIFHI